MIVYKQNGRIWGTGNLHKYFKNPMLSKAVTDPEADIGPDAYLGHFSSKISKEWPLHYRAMFNEFLLMKIEATFWFQ